MQLSKLGELVDRWGLHLTPTDAYNHDSYTAAYRLDGVNSIRLYQKMTGGWLAEYHFDNNDELRTLDGDESEALWLAITPVTHTDLELTLRDYQKLVLRKIANCLSCEAPLSLDSVYWCLSPTKSFAVPVCKACQHEIADGLGWSTGVDERPFHEIVEESLDRKAARQEAELDLNAIQIINLGDPDTGGLLGGGNETALSTGPPPALIPKLHANEPSSYHYVVVGFFNDTKEAVHHPVIAYDAEDAIYRARVELGDTTHSNLIVVDVFYAQGSATIVSERRGERIVDKPIGVSVRSKQLYELANTAVQQHKVDAASVAELLAEFTYSLGMKEDQILHYWERFLANKTPK